MQRYTSKPHAIHTQQWDGSADSDLIKALNASGWTTFVQIPVAGQLVNTYNEAESKWEPAPAKGRLVVIGPYRKQLFSLDAGQWLSWHEDDCSFGSQDNIPSDRDWAFDTQAPARTWPTPAELVALMDVEEAGW